MVTLIIFRNSSRRASTRLARWWCLRGVVSGEEELCLGYVVELRDQGERGAEFVSG